jgi:guanine deaminase
MNHDSLHDKFIARAIELAVENVRHGGGPFGALIVHDATLIAEGVNSVTTTNDPTAHAEVVAIREACKRLAAFDLSGCDLYSSCEPCPMCLGAIYWARPSRVYFAGTVADAEKFGFDDAFIYDEIQRRHGDRKIPMKHIAVEAALAPFRAWREKHDKIRY